MTDQQHCSFTLDWDPEYKEASLAALAELGYTIGQIYFLPRTIARRSGSWLGPLPDFDFLPEDAVLSVRAEVRPWGLKLIYGNGDTTGVYKDRTLDRLVFEEVDYDLCKLDVSYHDSLRDLNGLSKLINLRELSLRSCEYLADMKALSNLTGLRELKLVDCYSVEDASVLSGLKELRELSLWACPSVKDVSSLSNLFELRSLNLRHSKFLSDASILSRLEKLRDLDLSHCDSLGDVSDLSNLTELRRLNLHQCKSLNDVSSLSNLGKLRDLDLGECSSLTDISVLSKLTELCSLNLYSCECFKDVSMLSSLEELRELDLGRNSALVDVSALAGLKKVHKLNLRLCKSLKDVSALSGLMELRELNLQGCPYILGNRYNLGFLLTHSKLTEFEFDDPIFSVRVLLIAASLRKDAQGCLRHFDSGFDACRTMQDFELARVLSRAVSLIVTELGEAGEFDATAKLRELLDMVDAFEKVDATFWRTVFDDLATLLPEALIDWLREVCKERTPRPDLVSGFLEYLTSVASVDRIWLESVTELLKCLQSKSLRVPGPEFCLAYRCLGQPELADALLKNLTEGEGSAFRDRVLVCYGQHAVAQGDFAGARLLLAAIESPEQADAMRSDLAVALAASAPEEAGELLGQLLDPVEKQQLADKLQEHPSFTRVEDNLERLLSIQATDPSRFEALLRELLEQNPDNLWLGELKNRILPPPESSVDLASVKRSFLQELVQHGYVDLSQASAANDLIQ